MPKTPDVASLRAIMANIMEARVDELSSFAKPATRITLDSSDVFDEETLTEEIQKNFTLEAITLATERTFPSLTPKEEYAQSLVRAEAICCVVPTERQDLDRRGEW